MIRIIQSLTSPVQTVENPEPVEMVQIPNGAVSISTHDGIYLDYIIEDGQAIPADAIYVGRMEEDGTVTDLVGNSDTFPHSFLGWDKKAVPEEKKAVPDEIIPVEPV